MDSHVTTVPLLSLAKEDPVRLPGSLMDELPFLVSQLDIESLSFSFTELKPSLRLRSYGVNFIDLFCPVDDVVMMTTSLVRLGDTFLLLSLSPKYGHVQGLSLIHI